MTLRSKPSAVIKRSIVISGHKTSVSLEDPFWVGLKACAAAGHQTLSTYIGAIDIDRKVSNLSSTLRLHVLAQATAERDALLETQSKGSRLLPRPDEASLHTGNGFRTA
ncbi:MAG: arylsulfate sulfotransferase-related protein [Xanthobacteraceae bacterium]|jgi:predicted DNA-binding ribbon-helix-helix protein|nr:arylsulfate sulfotransferase-related protein [Xanthobacteraceae bacterium]